MLKKPLVSLLCCSNVRAVNARFCELKVLWVPCFKFFECFRLRGETGTDMYALPLRVLDSNGAMFGRYGSVGLRV